MNLAEKINKVKQKIHPVENDIMVVLIVIFTGLIAFGLGRLSALSERKTSIKIEGAAAAADTSAAARVKADNLFVASKNGAKYYYAWCGGAERIKEENKVWFKTKEEAEKAGYGPAANCQGL